MPDAGAKEGLRGAHNERIKLLDEIQPLRTKVRELRDALAPSRGAD